jgi:hypothetical protein
MWVPGFLKNKIKNKNIVTKQVKYGAAFLFNSPPTILKKRNAARYKKGL